MTIIQKIASVAFSLFVLTGVVAILALVSIKLPAKQDNQIPQYLLVFPFQTTHTQAIHAIIKADGSPVRTGTFDFLLIAASENPNFVKEIQKQGANFVFSPIISGGSFIQKYATKSGG